MSTLDQAIIKAYAKDRPAATTATADPERTNVSAKADAAASSRAVATAPSRAIVIDQVYRDGTLYRFDQALAPLAAPAQAIPRTHLASLPPTSPRRNVRRSLLRLLAASDQPAQSEESPKIAPRFARKVIIRHISHAAAPAPLGLRKPEGAKAPPHAPVAASPLKPVVELPPEKLDDDHEPPPVTFTPPPAPKSAPAPLNVTWENAPAIDIFGPWLHESSLAPLVMLSDATAARRHPAFAQWVVHVDAIAAARAEADALAAARLLGEPKPAVIRPAFQSKSLDLESPPSTKIYFDRPHAASSARAHARFPAEATPAEAESLAPTIEVPTIEAPTIELPVEPAAFASANETIVAATEPVVVAEESLASDLIPPAPSIQPEPVFQPAEPAPEPAVESQAAVPVWEVDRFQWPRTCEKLIADDAGYLASAGAKLLAAVQDGLRVLAITGTRRGEGRTTMALCLARMAAKAGLQVAIMDADFARPQIATKLGLETAHGWQDAALGKIPLSEAAVKSLADDITVLPLESSSVVRRLSLADARVTATIRAVAATFELVILDLGPVQGSERLAFPHDEGSPLDAAIVVRDVRFATTLEGEILGHMLQDLGVEAVGIAENFVIEEDIPATSV